MLAKLGQVATVRDLVAADEGAWRQLWLGYNSFYGTTVPETVTSRTWERILDPASAILGRLATINAAVVGFSVCYLEDLFVDPEYRGRGYGRLLIQDLVDRARSQGWSRLYWHTRSDNAARRLYDEFVLADDFVRYRLAFD
jgi:GNAT superfamily N-acetyltransferase